MSRTEDGSCLGRSRFPDRHEAAPVPGHGKRRLKGGAAPIPSPKRRKTRGGGHRSRPWVFSSRDFSSCKNRFVIVSYNILGVENASRHPDLYQLVDPKNMEWNRRKRRIRKELRRRLTALMTWQVFLVKMVMWVFIRFELEMQMTDVQCSGRKNSSLFCMKRISNFRSLDFGTMCLRFVSLSVQADSHRPVHSQQYLIPHLLTQVLDIHLDDLSTCSKSTQQVWSQRDRTLVVGNIHVLFNPNRGDVKLGQMRLLLEKAHEISEQWGNAPVAIAGDLNSVPQSALYQFVSDSKLDFLVHDRRNISGQIRCSLRQKSFAFRRGDRGSHPAGAWECGWSEEERLLASGSREQDLLEHRLRLRSAYAGVPGSKRTRDGTGEPLLTSYHSRFMGTVDYIWHSAGLAPVGVVETPPISALREVGSLPSERWGSDHLALVCEFAFVDGDGDEDDGGAPQASGRSQLSSSR